MEPCLICGGPILLKTNNNKVKVGLGADIPAELWLSGDDDNFVIREHLWVIFILRRFLQLPSASVRTYLLKSFGLSPGGWFSLCGACTELGGAAFGIHGRILELERELEGLRGEAKDRLRRSLEEEEEEEEGKVDEINKDGVVFSVRQEIRKDFTALNQNFEEKVNALEHLQVDLPNEDEAVGRPDEEEEDNEENNDFIPSENDDASSKSSSCSDFEKELRRRPVTSKPETSSKTTKRKRGRPKGSKTKPIKRRRRSTDFTYKCDKCDFGTNVSKISYRHGLKHKKEDSIVPTGKSPPSFSCTICGAEWPLRNEGLQHLREVHGAELGIKTYPCPTCDKIFDQRSQLSIHIRHVHDKAKRFGCDECGASYAKQVDFNDHVAKHLNPEAPVLICDLCGLKMSTRRSLYRHKKRFHGGGGDGEEVIMPPKKPLECSICHLKIVHSLALKQHLKSEHGDIYKYACDLCEATYIKSKSLAIHKKAAHAKETVNCPYCGRTVGCKAYLSGHWKKYCKNYPGGQGGGGAAGAPDGILVKVEGGGGGDDNNPSTTGTPPKYKCDKCDFQTNDGNINWKHVQKHKIKDHIVRVQLSPPSFRCTICQVEFPLRNDALQHLREAHGEQIGLKTYPCPSCDKIFDQRSQWNLHIQHVHNKQKKYCCDECGASYAQQMDFDDHVAKHLNNGKSSIICDICGLEMGARRSLARHRKKFHSNNVTGGGGDGGGASPSSSKSSSSSSVTCSLCHIQVVHTLALKQHLKSAHADIYSFPCDLCEATYLKSKSLEIHKKACHSKERVNCPYCGRSVGCKEYLGGHWKNHCKNYPGPAPKLEPAELISLVHN